jgi:hypothetical protein
MRRTAATFFLLLGAVTALPAADLQGVIVDWNCAKAMVEQGRDKVLRQNRSCSLMKDYNRQAYGLITDEQKFYRLEDDGNQHILQLLKNAPDRDSVKVVVKGELHGNTVKLSDISLL